MRTLYISAYQEKLGDPFGYEAVLATCNLMRRLRERGHKPRLARGKYNGKCEMSIVVDNYHEADSELQRCMRLFNQACTRIAVGTRVYKFDGWEFEPFGIAYFSSNPDEEPTNDYTFLPDTNQYMTVQDTPF